MGRQDLYLGLVEQLHERGFAGAMVLRGIEALRREAAPAPRTHREPVLELPIVIEAIDREDKVRATVPELDRMAGDGHIVVPPAEVVTYRSDGPSE